MIFNSPEKFSPAQKNLMHRVKQFDRDELTLEEEIVLIQDLIDNDMAWDFKFPYGRMARRLIKEGKCYPKA